MNTTIIVYRMLLIGIPSSMSSEIFYDYLRSHTCDRGLYNALLICPSKSSFDERAACAHLNLAGRLRRGRRKNKINVGAALVDFISKAFADAAKSTPFYMGKTTKELEWKPLGRVSCCPSMILEGSAHTMLSVSPLVERIEEKMRFRRHYGRQNYMQCRHSYLQDVFPKKERKNVTIKKSPFRGLRRVDTSTSSAGAHVDRDSQSSWRISSIIGTCEGNPLYLTTNSPFVAGLSTREIFSLLDFSFHHLCLGSIHTMSRLAASEVIIVTDVESSFALLQEKKITSILSTCHDTLPNTQIEWTVHPELKRSIEDLLFSTKAFCLATKEEAVTAIAHLYSNRGNTQVACKDKYGNLFLPCEKN